MTRWYLFIFFFFLSDVYSIPREYQDRIEKLVASNPGQLSLKEYTLIADTIFNRKACHLLVFGVGRDSQLWIDINKEGKTVFLEDNPFWLDYARKKVPNIVVFQVCYDTKRKDWSQLLSQPEKLKMDLPKEIWDTKWDIIFVDAPAGFSDDQPGRMKSIYTASFLAQTNTDVFVHDCDRIVECVYCSHFFQKSDLKNTIDRLCHYHINNKP